MRFGYGVSGQKDTQANRGHLPEHPFVVSLHLQSSGQPYIHTYEPVTRCIHVVQAFATSCHKAFTSSSSSWPSASFGLLQRGGRGASIYMVATGMVPRQQQMTSTRSWAGRWSLVSWLENASCTGMLFAGEAFGKICEAFGIVGPDPS